MNYWIVVVRAQQEERWFCAKATFINAAMARAVAAMPRHRARREVVADAWRYYGDGIPEWFRDVPGKVKVVEIPGPTSKAASEPMPPAPPRPQARLDGW